MAAYEIYWDDLSLDAKEKFKGLYHENIDLTPIAIIEIEDEEE